MLLMQVRHGTVYRITLVLGLVPVLVRPMCCVQQPVGVAAAGWDAHALWLAECLADQSKGPCEQCFVLEAVVDVRVWCLQVTLGNA